MNIHNFFSIYFLSCASMLHANTYVWEDYDDFSGNTLDNDKWEAAYFAGGNEASLENGRVKLSGSAYYDGSPTVVPDSLASAAANSTEGNAAILIQNSEIFGLEAELLLPQSGNSYEAGIFMSVVDVSPFEGMGPEIRYELTGTSLDYDFLNSSGNEESGYANASLDTAYKFSIINTEGKTLYYLDGVMLKEFTNSSRDADYWMLGAFNDQGNPFNATVDNVRVLRRKSNTFLDESYFVITTSEGLSLTLTFKNGTFTSTFEDPEEGRIVDVAQGYVLDRFSEYEFKIIDLDDGDITHFNLLTKTGSHIDYENGVIDTLGSWDFTFTQFAWEDYDEFEDASLDNTRWSAGYWNGGNLPFIESGKLTLRGNTEPGFNEVLPTAGMLQFNEGIKPLLEDAFSSSDETDSHSFVELQKDDILGIQVEVQLPADALSSTAIGLYASEWAKAFSEDQSDKSFFGLDLWRDHIDIEYVDPNTGEIIKNELFTTAGSSHTFAFIFEDGKVFMFVDGSKVAEFSSANFSRDSILIRAWNSAGEPFSAFAQNVRVIRNWEEYDDFSSGSLDSSKWEVAWWKGGRSPSVVNGALELGGSGDPSDPGSDSMPYQLSLLNLPEDGSTHPFAIITDSSVYGLKADVMLPVGSPYSTGLNFLCYDTTSQEADGSFKQFGPEIEYWSPGTNPTLDYQYVDSSNGEVVEVSIGAEFGVFYQMSLIQDGSRSLIFIDGEKVAEFDYSDFSPNAFGFFAFNDDGHAFESYVRNVRVLRRSQETTEPDPVTVVSDPSGNTVVVQVGDEYEWSSNLNGVTLWSVDESGGDIQPITMRFENGRNFGNEGFYDSVALPQPYDLPFVIDENGYIKVTEDSGYQYYHVVSVENGVIATLEGDEQGVVDDGVSVPDQWFFTTRAAAEEYYYSKVNPKNWMWFDQYPWVYSNEEQDWLYFYPSGGTLMYWSNKGQAWRQFN